MNGGLLLCEIQKILLPDIRDIVIQYSCDYDGEIREKQLEMINSKRLRDMLKEMTQDNHKEIRALAGYIAWLKQQRDYQCALTQKLSSVLIFKPFLDDKERLQMKHTQIVTLIHRATRQKDRPWTVHFKTPRIYVNYREVIDYDLFDDEFNYEDSGISPPTKPVYDLQLNLEHVNMDQFYWPQLDAYLETLFDACDDWIHYGQPFAVRSASFNHLVKRVVKNKAKVADDEDDDVDEFAEYHTTAIFLNNLPLFQAGDK